MSVTVISSMSLGILLVKIRAGQFSLKFALARDAGSSPDFGSSVMPWASCDGLQFFCALLNGPLIGD